MEERIYTINLRKRVMKTSKWRKTEGASRAVRDFLKTQLKVEEVKIGKSINEKIWERGGEKPPNKIRIKAIRDDEGVVRAEMLGVVFPEEIETEKKEKKTKEKDKKEEKK